MSAVPSRNLWTGFGVLLALLVLSTAVIIWRVSAVDGEVRGMADARNLGAAAADLEVDAVAYMLNVRTYLQTADPRALALSREAYAGVSRHLKEYRSLANSDGRHELATRFDPVWQEIVTLGESLVAPDNRRIAKDQSQRLFDLQRKLREVLTTQIRADALTVYNERKDDALRDVANVIQLAVAMIIGGSLFGLLVSTAVTRRIMQAERRLQSQRELLQVTLASIADAVISADESGVITYLNRVAEALTGWPSAEALGRSLKQVYQVSSGPDEGSANSGQSSDASLTARDGRTLPIDACTSPIRDQEGAVVGSVVVFRDATQRRRWEQELKDHAAALTRSNENKNEFLAMLAHELRNPLAPIRTSAEVLRRKTDQVPELRPAVAIIERQVTQMVRLVDDLVDITRISQGRIELRRQPTDLYTALQIAVEEITPLLDSSEHDLRVQFLAKRVIVDGDPERLAQMFSNLLHNAAKFTARNGRIEVVVKATCDDAFVQIRDNGIGIASENLPHVFDLYMQAGTSLQRSGSGVGIGLSLVKKIVELHGGSVRVKSEGLRRGSEFTVRLPLSAVRTAPNDDRIACPSIPSMRILVVDDNRDAADALSSLLGSEGHDVHIALHGAEALEIAKTVRPEVILLDLGLPSMDGFQIAEALRKADWGRDIPLIALTGWGQPENMARTTAAGFDAHLVKPVDLQGLYAKLVEVVHRSKPEEATNGSENPASATAA